MSALSRFLVTLLFLSAVALGQNTTASPERKDLKVAAAADLTYVVEKLGSAFENQTGVHVTVSLGSSGNFFSQIQNGAPFDVFLSADKGYPDKLDQAGKIEGRVVPYARGQLVIWVPNNSSLQLPSKDHVLTGDLKFLTGPAVRKIAIANPEHAPYGRAAVAALTHFGVYDQLKPKIVMGENISQTAQFGQSGNAEVTLIPLSLASSGSLQHDGRWLLLPEDSYPPIEQAGVVLRSSQNKAEAKGFLDFISSAEGQAIMHDFGFGAAAK